MSNQKNNQQIIIYQSKDRGVELSVRLQDETVWLSLNQIAELFCKDKSVISRHIRNIYQESELLREATVAKIATVQQEGGRFVKRHIEVYNLDTIISVGYRVNSQRATQFRIWATQTLKKYLLEGFVVNHKRLQEKQFERLKELEQATALLQKTIQRHDLGSDEAKGLLKVITDYTESWVLLHKYDEQRLAIEKTSRRIVYRLTYEDALQGIAKLRGELTKKKEAGTLFGVEREQMLAGVVGNIHQSFGGHELYPSIEEKAAHLLYFAIKDHPFSDGNKRIGAFLFIWFLARNRYLYGKNGEKKINDNTLVALALLIAESDSKQKDIMVKLIVNLINKR